MIPLDGRILPGLDEFMLRVGHLKVMSAVACTAGASWYRIEKETAAHLTRAVTIPLPMTAAVADYLERKHLCPTPGTEEGEEQQAVRYPDLRVVRHERTEIVNVAGEEPMIWWQDLMLASAGVRSRVGAITSAAKSGSKTGVSHLSDWASALDLISASGEITPEGRLLASFSGVQEGAGTSINPYVLGPEALIVAYLYARADADLLFRFTRTLIEEKEPIRKASGSLAFVRTIQGIVNEAEVARELTRRQQYAIAQHLKELETAARKGKKESLATSTAWHRAASRLETYVDLGLLDKGRGGEAERYEYVYYRTPRLQKVVHSLHSELSATQWIDRCLVHVLTDTDVGNGEPLSPDEVQRLLPLVVPRMDPRSNLHPLGAMAVGFAVQRLVENAPVSFEAARFGLENFAKTRPEAARLSRGDAGDRAEMISILSRLAPR